jgi:hypothetical protein
MDVAKSTTWGIRAAMQPDATMANAVLVKHSKTVLPAFAEQYMMAVAALSTVLIIVIIQLDTHATTTNAVFRKSVHLASVEQCQMAVATLSTVDAHLILDGHGLTARAVSCIFFIFRCH